MSSVLHAVSIDAPKICVQAELRMKNAALSVSNGGPVDPWSMDGPATGQTLHIISDPDRDGALNSLSISMETLLTSTPSKLSQQNMLDACSTVAKPKFIMINDFMINDK